MAKIGVPVKGGGEARFDTATIDQKQLAWIKKHSALDGKGIDYIVKQSPKIQASATNPQPKKPSIIEKAIEIVSDFKLPVGINPAPMARGGSVYGPRGSAGDPMPFLAEVGKSFINEVAKTGTSMAGQPGYGFIPNMAPDEGTRATEQAVLDARKRVTNYTEGLMDKSQAAGVAHFIGALPVDVPKFAVAGTGASAITKPISKFVGPTTTRLIHGGILGEQFGIMSGKDPISSLEDAAAFALFEGGLQSAVSATSGLGKSVSSLYRKSGGPVFGKIADAIETAEPRVMAVIQGLSDFISKKKPAMSESGAVIEPALAASRTKETARAAYEAVATVGGERKFSPNMAENLTVRDKVRLMKIRLAKEAKDMDSMLQKQFDATPKELSDAFRLSEAVQIGPDGNIVYGARERAIDDTVTDRIYKYGMRAIGRELRDKGASLETKKEVLTAYKESFTELVPDIDKEGEEVLRRVIKSGEDDGPLPENVQRFLHEYLGESSPRFEKYVAKHMWRYNPEQAETMWNEASPKVKEMATIARNTYDNFKELLGVESDIEAYSAHYMTSNIIDTAKRISARLKSGSLLKKKDVFSFEHKRRNYGQETGASTNLRANIRRYADDAHAKIARDKTFAEIEESVAQPYFEGSPIPPGYVAYTGQYSSALRGKKMIIPLAQRNYISKMSDDAVFTDVLAKQLYNSVKRGMKDLSYYWKLNALSLAVDTFVTNGLGGATQYAMKSARDMARMMQELPNPVKFSAEASRVYADLWGLGAAAKDTTAAILEKASGGKLKPAVPAYHFGGKASKYATELNEQGRTISKVGEVLLGPMGWVEDYFKRALLFSEVGPETRAIAGRIESGTASQAEEKLYQEALNAIDTFGLNYENNPEWINKLRDNAVPFISYIYNAGKMIGSMTGIGPVPVSRAGDMIKHAERGELTSAEAIGLFQNIKEKYARTGKLAEADREFIREFTVRDKKERIARAIALYGTIGGLATGQYLLEQKEGHKELYGPKVPSELSMRGRVGLPVGDKEKIYAMRVAKYNPLMMAAAYGIRGKAEPALETLAQEGVGFGPLVDMGLAIKGYGTKYTQDMTQGERIGANLASYTPGQRALSSVSRFIEQQGEPSKKMFLYDRPGFVAQVTQNIPGVSNITKGGPKLYRYSKNTREQNWRWFWVSKGLGLNIKEIDKAEVDKWKEENAQIPDKYKVDIDRLYKLGDVEQGLEKLIDKANSDATLTDKVKKAIRKKIITKQKDINKGKYGGK